MKYESIRWEQVSEGARLPRLTREITATTIIAGAIASRDFMPVHHDRDFAIRQGAPDIFPNVMTIGGWLGKYLTDWSGPEADLRRLDLRLGMPCFPGTTLTFSGRVSRKYLESCGRLIDVEFEATLPAGPHAQAVATLAFPGQGRMTPNESASAAAGSPADGGWQALHARIGEELVACRINNGTCIMAHTWMDRGVGHAADRPELEPAGPSDRG